VGAATGSYPRIPHHPCRFPPGSPRWEQQLAATLASPPPLSLSTGFTPVGATTGSYPRIPHHPSRFPPGSPRWEHNWQLPSHPPPPLPLSTGFIPVGATTGSYPRRSALQFLRLGLRPNWDEGRGDALCSCQSWLHRHKADGGPEEPEGLSFKVLGRAEMRTTSHGFPPGSPRWKHNWQLPSHPPTIPIAFHRVHPGGSNNWQLPLDAPRSNPFAWGFAPSGMRGGGVPVAASHGSTGTRPMEAQKSRKV
jgi:hypothetical protein